MFQSPDRIIMERDREGNLLGSLDVEEKWGRQRKGRKGRKKIIKTFIEEPEVIEKLGTLTVSTFAVYKNPHTWFENLANIITVAMEASWGSPDVYEKYQDWTSREDDPLQEISEYLDRATRKIRGISVRQSGKKTQTLIPEYFAFKSDPDLENNQSKEEKV